MKNSGQLSLSDDSERKTLRFTVRMSPSEYDQISLLASEKGLSISEFLISSALVSNKSRLEMKIQSLEVRYSEVLSILRDIKRTS